MQIGENLHLTYCSNIHPAAGWQDVRDSVLRYGRELKSNLSPDQKFGIGLRLSGEESEQFLEDDRLASFKRELEDAGLYVFTMNAFPHGTFHKSPVKDEVHAPDWMSRERVGYTKRCIKILAELLPKGMEGGISTNPLSYRPWFGEEIGEDNWYVFTAHLIEIVVNLAQLEEEKGVFIHIDIEPEPDGVFENSEQLVSFFSDRLLKDGAKELGALRGCSIEEARKLILRHLQVCWDTCHVAVAFEDAEAVLKSYNELGIKVGKIQISSALQVDLPIDPSDREVIRIALEKFVESVYLHQVVQRNHDQSFKSFLDLDQALGNLDDPEAEQWRIHFHVPIFAKDLGEFGSTQSAIEKALILNKGMGFTRHLEIETYTWDVLPSYLKQEMAASIQREYEWVLDLLA